MSTLREDLLKFFQNEDVTKDYDSVCDFFMNGGSLEYDDEIRNWLTERQITAELVEEYGGEDQGSDYWSVWRFGRIVKTDRFVREEVFYKFSGWYASYVGAEFEEVFEVEPTEVMNTEWKTVE